MSLRDEWLADPEQLTYAEWLRRHTVPPGLLTLQPPEVQRAERAKVERKPSAYKRKSRAKPGGRAPVHGSTHGWKRHRDAGEDPCADCVAGHEAEKARRAAEKRAQRAARGVKRRQAPRCGSPSGARKHRRDGEEVCPACRQAERDEWHNRKKKRPEQQEAAA